MTIDWAKPICIAATDWQDELPARVVDGGMVAIDAPHRIFNGGRTWPSGESWYCGADGEVTGYPEIWVINKIEKDNKMPTKKSLDEAAKSAGYSDWVAAQGLTLPSSYITQSIAAHALTLDQLHGRVEVSEAERLYREIVGVAYHYSGQSISRELDKDDLAAIAILEKALADANAPKWIEWHGGECPVAADARAEVKFRNGDTDEASADIFARYGDIIAYRVL